MVLVSNKHKDTRKDVTEKSCSVQNYIYIYKTRSNVEKTFPNMYLGVSVLCNKIKIQMR